MMGIPRYKPGAFQTTNINPLARPASTGLDVLLAAARAIDGVVLDDARSGSFRSVKLSFATREELERIASEAEREGHSALRLGRVLIVTTGRKV